MADDEVRWGPAARRPAPPRPQTTWSPRRLVRVVLCEDREVFRLGLRVVLEAQPDMAVVAETSHLPGAQAAAAADAESPVVVVRHGLAAGDTLPVLRDLCRRGTPVLVLADPCPAAGSELVDLLRAGVRGCLPRRSTPQSLVDAVRALARHEAALDPTATSQLVRHLTADTRAPRPPRPLDLLTERQRDVAELVAEGMSNEEIAGRLFLSLATVKSHLTASMRRLDVRSRTELAILVHRHHDRTVAI